MTAVWVIKMVGQSKSLQESKRCQQNYKGNIWTEPTQPRIKKEDSLIASLDLCGKKKESPKKYVLWLTDRVV